MMEQLSFKQNNKDLTLGIELEFQIIDRKTLRLTPKSAVLLDIMNDSSFCSEFFQSTVELVTGVCSTVQEADDFIRHKLELLTQYGKQLDITFARTGTHPLADYRDRIVTPTERYLALVERNQWLIRRMAVYGMHVHLGMSSGNACIDYQKFFTRFIPHLIALSASSPFWQRMDTGLDACRPTMYEALPTAGLPYRVKDWRSFQRLYKFMIRSSAISSFKDLWWDIRPSPFLGTLELRMCDGPATQKEAMAIVAFTHALSFWYKANEFGLREQNSAMQTWIMRENKWRAIRYGLNASVIIDHRGTTMQLKDNLQEWIDRLSPTYQQLKYQQYLGTLLKIIEQGNSSQRQRQVFSDHGSLESVVAHNVGEFNLQT